MSHMSDIQSLIDRLGFSEKGELNIAELVYYPEIRDICATDQCRCYGKSWSCPPAVGTLEECRQRIESYDTMILFSLKTELEDSFDYEGMMEGAATFKELAAALQAELQTMLPRYLLMALAGCKKCGTCTYPDAPCRHPESMFHSLEGYGFDVHLLAEAAGIKYNNGPNTVTYFGAILFDN